MNAYVNTYIDFVKQLKEEYLVKSKELETEDKMDEAILMKVRANICEVFFSVIGAAEKKMNAKKILDKQEQVNIFNQEYLNMFQQIPISWRTRLELAKKNDDLSTVITEEAKLETAELLKMEFIRLGGL